METRRPTPAEREVVLRALTRCGVAEREVCERAVASCRLVRRSPSIREVRGLRSLVAYLALRSRASGITLGDEVYVRSDVADEGLEMPRQLLAHELTHVAQFRRAGFARFLARYVGAYLRGRARGLGDERAYRAIPYEREARLVAACVASLDPRGPARGPT